MSEGEETLSIVGLSKELKKICKRILKKEKPKQQATLDRIENDIIVTFNKLSLAANEVKQSRQLTTVETENLNEIFKGALTKVAQAFISLKVRYRIPELYQYGEIIDPQFILPGEVNYTFYTPVGNSEDESGPESGSDRPRTSTPIASIHSNHSSIHSDPNSSVHSSHNTTGSEHNSIHTIHNEIMDLNNLTKYSAIIDHSVKPFDGQEANLDTFVKGVEIIRTILPERASPEYSFVLASISPRPLVIYPCKL